jgi:hypothetical protein
MTFCWEQAYLTYRWHAKKPFIGIFGVYADASFSKWDEGLR